MLANEKTPQIGIIGGSGFDDPTLFENQVERRVTTPFGSPSDVIIEGQIKGVPCALLARHGRKHQIQPSDINYRANIWSLKQVGCTHVLATTATGSLVEQYKPGDLVILDDFIDRTWNRKCTFYDRTEGGPKGVCHLPMRPAFCERARQAMYRAAKEKGYAVHERGTAVVIQGPRFSSRAESLMHRQWGGHLVNMTTVPEAVLAKEAGLSYAAVALVTDYDCWRENETKAWLSLAANITLGQQISCCLQSVKSAAQPRFLCVEDFTSAPPDPAFIPLASCHLYSTTTVSVSEVLAMFSKNVKKAADVIVLAVQTLAAESDLAYLDAHQELVSSAIMLKE